MAGNKSDIIGKYLNEPPPHIEFTTEDFAKALIIKLPNNRITY